jgi:hypothetical protein
MFTISHAETTGDWRKHRKARHLTTRHEKSRLRFPDNSYGLFMGAIDAFTAISDPIGGN